MDIIAPENEIQLIRILQCRHLLQRPIEMLVKVRINSIKNGRRFKEIWLSKSYIQSQERGQILLEEFNKTKVSKNGVDMYLGRRRSNIKYLDSIKSQNNQNVKQSDSIINNFSMSVNKENIKKIVIPSNSKAVKFDITLLDDETNVQSNINQTSGISFNSLITKSNNRKYKKNSIKSKNLKNKSFADLKTKIINISDDSVLYSINKKNKVIRKKKPKFDLNIENNLANSEEIFNIKAEENTDYIMTKTCLMGNLKNRNQHTQNQKKKNSFKRHQGINKKIIIFSKPKCFDPQPPRLYPILDDYPHQPIISNSEKYNFVYHNIFNDEKRLNVRQLDDDTKFKDIIVRRYPGYIHIILSTRMSVKNVFKNTFNPSVFNELCIVLNKSIYEETKVILLSGSSDIFSSGIDLNYLTEQEVDRSTAAHKMIDSLREFINTLISFPKLLIAAVNGPAIGLGTAFLPLFDMVYASDKASFFCPYIKLCQTPEACSSHTFDKMMGFAMANDMLLRGKRLTALEGCQVGLVSQVFWPDHLMAEVLPRIQQIAQQSSKCLEYSKELMRCRKRGKLESVNSMECRMLMERWTSNECQSAIKNYIQLTSDTL